jgi:hypothetical protein
MREEIKLKTKALPEEVYYTVKPAIDSLLERHAKRKHFHIVMMDPQKKPWECTFEEAILAEFSLGVECWKHDYKAIARSKAKQAWRNQQANIVTQMLGPATLLPGDTVYYGSFEYYGMIVACSGVEAYFDMLISGWMALTYQQMSQHFLTKYKTTHPEEDFLP